MGGEAAVEAEGGVGDDGDDGGLLGLGGSVPCGVGGVLLGGL